MTAAQTPNPLLPIALSAAAAGLSVLPPRLDGSKAPMPCWRDEQGKPTWKPAQLTRADEAQIREWYGDPRLTGIGCATGRVSGNLELFEFDDRAAYLAYVQAAEAAGLGELVARIESGYHEESPKPGVHWLYRCAEIGGNVKLASRPKTAEEMTHPKDREQVLIETRGEGGFVVIAPSNGKVHPSGGQYRLIAGGFDSIATITPEERRDLWALARSFDEIVKPEPAPNPRTAPPGTRPGDDFNANAGWRELLEAQGWTFVYRRGDCDYWRRPGKRQGVSACTGWGGRDYFYCFSTSTEFEAAKPYDKFGFHVLTVFAGDFKAAVKALAEGGYGSRTPGSGPAPTEPKAEAAGTGANLALDAYRGTDDGNAGLFLHLHGSDVRFCPPWDKWLLWSGSHWRMDDRLDIHRLAADVPRLLYRAAGEAADSAQRRAIADLARKLEGTARQANMLTAVRHHVVVHHSDLDKGHFLLNASNGTVDLTTGRLREHARADLLTHDTEIRYDRNATAPTWIQFLHDVFASDADLIQFVQRAVGYSLTGDVREQVLLIGHGFGSNGKSVFLNILRKMLGKLALQAAPDLLMADRNRRHPTEQADLFGKRLVVCQETGEGRRFNETLVKQLTGGDAIRARRMHEDFWEFAPTHKLWLSTNHRPEIRGTDYAIWRRIRLIPFDVVFTDDGTPRKDPTMEARLMAELPGILAWAVAGCLDWQKYGLGTASAVKAATANYQADMDVLASWLADCCVMHCNAKARASALYRAYSEWCERGGEHAENQRRFGQRLAERGFQRFSNDGVWYRGIGLRAEGTEGTEPISPIFTPPTSSAQNFSQKGSDGSVHSVNPPDDGLSSAPPPVDTPPAGDAAELWNVLKLYKGWETGRVLARKLGWNESRVVAAAMELQRRGLAATSGEFVKPVQQETAP